MVLQMPLSTPAMLFLVYLPLNVVKKLQSRRLLGIFPEIMSFNSTLRAIFGSLPPNFVMQSAINTQRAILVLLIFNMSQGKLLAF